MAAELKNRMGLHSVLRDVGKGRFDVTVDGAVIFSKNKAGRYPAAGEITKLLRTR